MNTSKTRQLLTDLMSLYNAVDVAEDALVCHLVIRYKAELKKTAGSNWVVKKRGEHVTNEDHGYTRRMQAWCEFARQMIREQEEANAKTPPA